MQGSFIYLNYVNIMFTTLTIVKIEMKKKKVMFAQQCVGFSLPI